MYPSSILGGTNDVDGREEKKILHDKISGLHGGAGVDHLLGENAEVCVSELVQEREVLGGGFGDGRINREFLIDGDRIGDPGRAGLIDVISAAAGILRFWVVLLAAAIVGCFAAAVVPSPLRRRGRESVAEVVARSGGDGIVSGKRRRSVSGSVLSDGADDHCEGLSGHAHVIIGYRCDRLAGLVIRDAVFGVHQELVISGGGRPDGWPIVGSGLDALSVVFDALEVRLCWE
jgi:hypothetical protein